ncbi:glycosyltransferase family 4 protein [Caulobacter endophyticus]|uniref:glycosyltransferase family 4 protein n=1 Tax=Caulobacter endophyticus TaxID=2172652 RepID=UPI00240FB059|nr:glycosyltransferase family 4 protein [Caulobacter endophyticus]MDG2528271.1 glycosyltransferase family 4 protein [Caulobacter endophyticus]
MHKALPLRPLKIVSIASFMNVAGAQEALVRLSRQLRARGHQVEVRFLYQEALAFEGDPHVKALIRSPRLGAKGYLKAFAMLLGELRREKPDAVICFMPLGTVMGAMAAFLAGVPIRIASQRAPGPTFGKLMRALDRVWGTIGLYDQIVCVSGAVKDSFDSYPAAYRRKLSVVHNGIEWSPSRLDRSAVRTQFGLPQDEILILALGRMKRQKNYSFLLERIAETPGAFLVVAGDGEERPMLEDKVEALNLTERVRFLGNVDRAGAAALLAGCDVFIQPSLYEGQSNAVLEAMHAGLPIIVSDIPEQRETVCDIDGTEAAVLCKLDEPASWAPAIKDVISSGQRRADLGAMAKAVVERRFSLKAMIDGFEKVLAEEVRA